MMYGTRKFNNGNKHGYLEFQTGKLIVMNAGELKEFEAKLKYWKHHWLEQQLLEQT